MDDEPTQEYLAALLIDGMCEEGEGIEPIDVLAALACHGLELRCSPDDAGLRAYDAEIVRLARANELPEAHEMGLERIAERQAETS